MTRSLALRALALSGLTGAALLAHAQATLLPNQQINSIPQISRTEAEFTREATASTPVIGRDADGNTTFTGTFSTVVYRKNGRLVFFYTFTNDATSTDAVERISLSSFAGFDTAVETGLTNGQVLASTASRSMNGNVVSFGYAPGSAYGSIMPGTSSRYVNVYTNATTYKIGSAQFLSSGVATVPTFVPLSSAVPEPASIAAIGIGVAALLRRRRR